MGISDTKAVYEISSEAVGETYVYKYGIVAYNSEPIAEYEALNIDYIVNDKLQLEAPITSVYV